MEYRIQETAICRFGRELFEQERAKKTIERYQHQLRAFAQWTEGRTVTKELTVRYKQWLMERYSPASVNVTLAALNGFFKFMGWQECRVRPVRVQRRHYAEPSRELSREEYYRLLKIARQKGNMRLFHLLETICSTGIRVSELRFITVQAVKRGRADICNKGKYRTILLPRKLCEKLLEYCRERGIWQGSVFVTRSGRPIDRTNVWAMMKALCTQAHVDAKKVFPHNLRNLFARCFYQKQRDLEHLATLLGHSSINTTRIYTRTSGEEHLRQIERLGLLL
ncbi:tyrosine-type recombinase/integrase [Allofournierella massiliensis]|uniref:tyrosine-type recombinase/integrase n=1 Tax=Allofournierella massiliensis TaxID=1650663 RepID=UPI003564433A